MSEVLLPRKAVVPLTMDRAFTLPPLVPRSPPELNPRFEFPSRPQNDAFSTSAYPSQPLEEATLSHGADRSRPQKLTINSLPAFEFPASSSSNSESGSPTRSQMRQRPCSPYHIVSAHRRNGSEFIGGDGKSGGGDLLSTSPAKGDGVLTLPMKTQTASSSTRRGHAHRRSGAISSHDLSDIMKLSRESRGSSLPTTPSELQEGGKFPLDGKFPLLPTRSTSQPKVSSAFHDLPSNPHPKENDSPRTQPRTRVGFSDTIEVIPRPLSTISSDTSSSLSTIHASHSASGSVTSILSSSGSSLLQTRLSRSLTNLPCETEETQIMLGTAGPRSNEVTERTEASSSTVHPQGSSFGAGPESRGPKSDDAVNLEISSIPSTPMRELTVDRSTDEDSYNLVNTRSSPAPPEAALQQKQTATLVRPRSSPEPTVSQRQRKVTSWAGSTLSPKAAFIHPAENSFHATTSPMPSRAFAPSHDLLDDISFDEDTTCVIRDPSQLPTTSQAQRIELPLRTQDHNSNSDDAESPMLDLDAALRAEPSNDAPEGFFSPRRRMHSSGALGRFSGQSMRYHRRAESAPEMPPIDYHTFGFPRFGSNPKMADVFEEDEEQQEQENVSRKGDGTLSFASTTPASEKKEASTGLAVGVSKAATVGDEAPQSKRFHQTVPAEPGTKAAQLPIATPWTLNSVDSVQEAGAGDDSSVEIVEADEEPRSLSVIQALKDSSAPAPPSDIFAQPIFAPSDLTLPKLSGLYPTPETSSAVSSPDFNRTSFEMPRLHTGTSSNTEWAMGSSGQAGEHGLSLRGSVDDVPSLTSSASTMIGAQPPRMSSGAYSSSSAQRSSSLSVAVPHRTRPATATKRSSLASLSRLVGSSSSGERSKLNLEERASPETVEKVDRKRSGRISRMMRLWKSKEKRRS